MIECSFKIPKIESLNFPFFKCKINQKYKNEDSDVTLSYSVLTSKQSIRFTLTSETVHILIHVFENLKISQTKEAFNLHLLKTIASTKRVLQTIKTKKKTTNFYVSKRKIQCGMIIRKTNSQIRWKCENWNWELELPFQKLATIGVGEEDGLGLSLSDPTCGASIFNGSESLGYDFFCVCSSVSATTRILIFSLLWWIWESFGFKSNGFIFWVMDFLQIL